MIPIHYTIQRSTRPREVDQKTCVAKFLVVVKTEYLTCMRQTSAHILGLCLDRRILRVHNLVIFLRNEDDDRIESEFTG